MRVPINAAPLSLQIKSAKTEAVKGNMERERDDDRGGGIGAHRGK